MDHDVIGIPIGNDPDEAPLSYSELSSLKKGDILWVLEDDESDESWSRVTFVGLEHDGFIFKNSLCEEVFYPTQNDDDMPVIYLNKTGDDPLPNKENVDTNQPNEQQIDYTLKDFNYDINSKIFVYDDANNFIPYTIESYDKSTTKATLRDNSGVVKQIYLKQFKHENANRTESKKLDIKSSTKTVNDGDKSRLGQSMNIENITGHWNWIQRTNSMKLKWISYKNTLLGTIAGATKHLYPIGLGYKDLMFISGLGLGLLCLYNCSIF